MLPLDHTMHDHSHRNSFLHDRNLLNLVMNINNKFQLFPLTEVMCITLLHRNL